MIRRIIAIDREKCSGCGLCAQACHEGAIEMEDGKAVLRREHFCDGLGDCLPACPTGAISFEEREAPAYDQAAVLQAKGRGGCPGNRSRTVEHGGNSRLRNWPVQMKLADVYAPYFAGADLLIAADCTAFACGNLHERFIQDRVVLIGCPKLDEGDYGEKLARLFSAQDIRSITVLRMEVPCCGGLVRAVRQALSVSGKDIPCRVTILSVDGRIVRES